MGDTVKDLKDVFNKHASKVGIGSQSSSIVVANLNANTAPMCLGQALDEDEGETDDFRLVEFVIDGSGSMIVVEDLVRELFNEVIMPGLLGGAAKTVGALRYAGLKFNHLVTPLWQTAVDAQLGKGWLKLVKDFPKLTPADYEADGSTALHQAIEEAVTAAAVQATQVYNITRTPPQVTIVCLTDGMNRYPPMDGKKARLALSELDPRFFKTVLIGFETDEIVDFRKVGRDLGFHEVMDSKTQPGETKEQQRARFRHIMGVFSDSLVKHVSSPIVGAQASQGGGTSFFGDTLTNQP